MSKKLLLLVMTLLAILVGCGPTKPSGRDQAIAKLEHAYSILKRLHDKDIWWEPSLVNPLFDEDIIKLLLEQAYIGELDIKLIEKGTPESLKVAIGAMEVTRVLLDKILSRDLLNPSPEVIEASAAIDKDYREAIALLRQES